MKIPESFLSLIKDEHARDLFCEYAEIALDGVTDSENLENIPLISTLTKCGKFVLSFRDRAFVKKIGLFLEEAKKIDPEVREKYFNELGDEKERIKAGEKLLILIDRLDSNEKAKVVGRLFRMRVEGALSESWFGVITNAIDKVYFSEFHLLRHGYKNPNLMENQLGEIFVPFRLVERSIKLIPSIKSNNMDYPAENNVKVEYKVSNIGMKLINVLNEEYDKQS